MHGRKNIKCTLSVKLKYAGRKKCYKQHVSFMLMAINVVVIDMLCIVLVNIVLLSLYKGAYELINHSTFSIAFLVFKYKTLQLNSVLTES